MYAPSLFGLVLLGAFTTTCANGNSLSPMEAVDELRVHCTLSTRVFWQELWLDANLEIQTLTFEAHSASSTGSVAPAAPHRAVLAPQAGRYPQQSSVGVKRGADGRIEITADSHVAGGRNPHMQHVKVTLSPSLSGENSFYLEEFTYNNEAVFPEAYGTFRCQLQTGP